MPCETSNSIDNIGESVIQNVGENIDRTVNENENNTLLNNLTDLLSNITKKNSDIEEVDYETKVFKKISTFCKENAGDYMREYYDSDYESHYEFYDPDPLEMHIYTDGACRNNHLVMYGGSEAGYGVYFGRNDHRNQSGRVPGNQTNQSAELYAIYRALEYYFQDVTN
ncbi:hypothetical protein C6P40_001193, partial [Pichia californica]